MMIAPELALLTPAEMARADALTIAAGTPVADLMEQAGLAVAEAARRRFAPCPTLVLAGPGNNGGDARIAHRLLREWGWPARLAEGEGLAPEAIGDAALIIDGIFGAGLSRDVDGQVASLITEVNRRGLPVLAIDVPSGLDGETGQARGVAFRAARTVTFFRMKPGHLLMPGRELCGELELARIGIADDVLETIKPMTWQNGPSLWQLPNPGTAAHKYAHGHALIVTGGPWQTGAARLAACAALKAGAGLVSYAAPPAALPVLACHSTAIMLREAEQAVDLARLLDDPRFRAVLVGPAAGVNATTRAMAEAALTSAAATVLDADALSVFASDSASLHRLIQNLNKAVVLTPHEGEFMRLFRNLRHFPESKLERARLAARAAGGIILLKGPDTVIAHPDGRAVINSNAPASLATAGSGDVLAGIITGLLARGMDGFEAACAAAWLHGEAARRVGQGLTAEELAEAVVA